MSTGAAAAAAAAAVHFPLLYYCPRKNGEKKSYGAATLLYTAQCKSSSERVGSEEDRMKLALVVS